MASTLMASTAAGVAVQAQTHQELHVRIWRGAEEGELRDYRVPLRDNQTVLDVVSEVQQRCDPTLAYRFACRVGVCGSCAMTVNGAPRWSCRTHIKDVAANGALTVEPLRNLPRIKDLVCDFDPFFDRWHRAGGQFQGVADRHQTPAAIDPQQAARQRASAGIECINCAVCYSACDVVAWDADYLGPAALNRAWTLVHDERHSERQQTLDKAMARGGCGSCHSQGNCTRYCPVALNPAASIAGLKRAAFTGLPAIACRE